MLWAIWGLHFCSDMKIEVLHRMIECFCGRNLSQWHHNCSLQRMAINPWLVGLWSSWCPVGVWGAVGGRLQSQGNINLHQQVHARDCTLHQRVGSGTTRPGPPLGLQAASAPPPWGNHCRLRAQRHEQCPSQIPYHHNLWSQRTRGTTNSVEAQNRRNYLEESTLRANAQH